MGGCQFLLDFIVLLVLQFPFLFNGRDVGGYPLSGMVVRI